MNFERLKISFKKDYVIFLFPNPSGRNIVIALESSGKHLLCFITVLSTCPSKMFPGKLPLKIFILKQSSFNIKVLILKYGLHDLLIVGFFYSAL